MLQLKNIKKSYTTGTFTQHALKDVSLKFRQSEFVAILGPSGSGKTTLLNIIGGLDQYDSGDLIINNKSTKKFKNQDWDSYRNNSVGFVFQNYNLITHISVLDNVEMGMTLSGISSTKRREKALEVLNRVGLKDHTHKKPNQLSGGQMQRVAIARALANDPDIILADEPTGALDSKTSVQIMELIKEIAKDKLVIMVTHNSEIAHQYANRIIQVRDGLIEDDSNPTNNKDENKKEYVLQKTSMNFLTALKLSLNNIFTKKGRTLLTSFASSIGIIGIALILALSNGFDKQIDNFEADTLSGFPIIITQSTTEMDREEMKKHRNDMMNQSTDENRYPTTDSVYLKKADEKSIVHSNIFTKEYIEYIEKINPDLISGVTYMRMANLNLLKKVDDNVSILDKSMINFGVYPKKTNDKQQGYLEKNYDLLAGSFPQDKTDLILIVDTYNNIDASIVESLGFDESLESLKYNDIIGKEFKLILNNDYYTKTSDIFIINKDLNKMYNSKKSLSVKISGIIRVNKDTSLEILPSGISYSDELTQFFMEDSKKSDIVVAQESADYNVLTGQPFKEQTKEKPSGAMGTGPNITINNMSSASGTSNLSEKDTVLAYLGASSTPYMVTIYPTNFESKDGVTTYLNNWNNEKEEKDTIIYTDLAETFTSLSGSIMSAITIVLVSFSAISLIVSSIMIGIIMYISVLERTKEIGILRSLGARKKDVSRVFNAETFIIGLSSGFIGITIARLLIIPTNSILKDLTNISNIAQLNPIHALLLITVSIILTLIGGWIPAKLASKKDPVEALRTE